MSVSVDLGEIDTHKREEEEEEEDGEEERGTKR